MEDDQNQKPHRASRKDHCGSHRSQGVHEETRVKCSGKTCRSWAAAAIADCVALCCCPCAVVNLITLAFVKVPWMIGRKCIGRGGRSKKRRKKIKREDSWKSEIVSGGCCGGGVGDGEFYDHRFVVERDGSLTKEEEKTVWFNGEDETRISARVEAERVWLELYQIGHLGFENSKKVKNFVIVAKKREDFCGSVRMGSRGLGRFQKVFVGTMGEYCVKHAECPVMTIKRNADETPSDRADD